MTYSPIAIKRKNVLGDIYNQCETVERIPVFMNDNPGEPLGYVDESMGHYADAFLFHLPEDVCKKLSTGHYSYGFDYDFSDKSSEPGKKRRIRLNHIVLVVKTVSSII